MGCGRTDPHSVSSNDLNYDVALLTLASLRWSHERLTSSPIQDSQRVAAESRDTMENAKAILAAVRSNMQDCVAAWDAPSADGEGIESV